MATTAADVLIDIIHIEAVVVPLEPPLPANISLKQAAKFAESLAKGEPNRTKIALTVLSDKMREMI